MLSLDCWAFHSDCDNKGICLFLLICIYLGSTLVIMHSNDEPNCFFGGMAAPEWNSEGYYIEDPANECSWLFKLECKKNK